jgi:nucleoside-diphosphate-sugar epimerase
LKPARILVTGGTGFIGRNLLSGKEFQGAQFSSMSRTKAWHSLCRNQIWADVRSYEFKKREFTHVIHAAEAGPRGSQNVVGSGAKVLLISSGAAYYPGTPYSDAKLASEKIVKDSGGIICRLFTFMGPHLPLSGNFAAGNFIRDAVTTGVIKIKGDGSALRSYMHTRDMSAWVWKILKNGKPGEAYDVGSNESISMLELATYVSEIVEKKTGKRVEIEVEGGNPASLAPHRYVPIKGNDLGLKQTLGTRETISSTIDWVIESLK